MKKRPAASATLATSVAQRRKRGDGLPQEKESVKAGRDLPRCSSRAGASAIATLDGRYGLVAKALEEADDLPKHVCAMLRASLPACLGAPGTVPRHRFVEDLGDMVGEALRGVEARLLERVQAAKALLSLRQGEVDASRERHEEAAAVVGGRAADVVARRAVMDEASTAQSSARQALARAVSEQRSADAELNRAAVCKERLAALSVVFPAVREGTLPQPQLEEFVAELGSLGSACRFDASMLLAIPTALKTSPAHRGAFDALVVHQVGMELPKSIASLAELLESSESAREGRVARVQDAQADLACCDERELLCKSDLEKAKGNLREAEVAAGTAKVAVERCLPELQRVASGLERAENTLGAFRTGPLVAFAELRAARVAVAPA